MRAILDTHVAVWWIAGEAKIGGDVRAMIADPRNGILVSIASAWEIAIKNSLKPARSSNFGVSVSDALAAFAESDFTMLEIAPHHLAAVESLEAGHGDPFDRMLVAQAMTEKLTLITHDRQLAAYGASVLLV